MPQLDISSFISLLIIIPLFFFFFYFKFVLTILPKISKIVKFQEQSKLNFNLFNLNSSFSIINNNILNNIQILCIFYISKLNMQFVIENKLHI